MIGDLTNNNDNIDAIGDMVEKELASMDKAIEEAAQKIVVGFKKKSTTKPSLKFSISSREC